MRSVHDVLVHREVIASPVPVSVPHRVTVGTPGRLGLLGRRERKAWVAPFLGWRWEWV
jgi:hypothetical protein